MSRYNGGKFLKVMCGRCGHKQIVYGRSSIKVKCEKCNKLLVKVGGGKVRIRTAVVGVLR